MICPRCQSKMKVTHSYATEAGRAQRLVCRNCGISATAVSLIVAVDPGVGEGVDALTKKLRQQKTPPSVTFGQEGEADKGR